LLSDLRSSGSIEQDADIIAFVYRDEYYNPDSDQKGIAEINIAKFRAGRTGVVYMNSNLAQCRFDNLAGYVPPQKPITKKRGGFDYE
jgi:replicative DNA helicase